ncbi:MAG TPA: TraB/GumN family protein [Pseudoxanthomonas sp.]|nr:TraB/GumN family protein [Pseudoxanthomonas sp.]
MNHRWKCRWIALSLALCIGPVLAQAPAVKAPAKPAQSAQTAAAYVAPVPLLWKVSDADNAVYLLGSFHMLRASDYPLSKDAEAAFADAASLMLEISPEEANSPELRKAMMDAAMRRDDSSLATELGPETWTELQAWSKRNGMPAEALARFETWMVGLTISLVEMSKQGLDPKLGLDQHFMDKAKQAGKPAVGLEKATDQIGLLDGMDAQEQKQLVKQSLEEAGKGPEYSERLHSAWRNGDADFIWRETAQELKREFPRLYQRINVDRNNHWLPQIEQRLQQPGTDNTLVVVGALHLLGDDGVVAKLRAKGYKVERICSACKR